MCSALAFAQLDSLALRAKLGPPLHRETFHVAAGFDMIVDYASGGRVCRLEVPALMPSKDNPMNADVMRQRMIGFLADVVPMSIRGTPQGSRTFTSGPNSVTTTVYENVSMIEPKSGADPFSSLNTITITFKNEPCDR